VLAVDGRLSLIRDEFKEELYKYITGIVRNNQQKLIAIIVQASLPMSSAPRNWLNLTPPNSRGTKPPGNSFRRSRRVIER